MGEDFRCSCKGIRTCLMCETLQSVKQNDHTKEKSTVYFYNPETCEAEFHKDEQVVRSFSFPGVLVIDNFITDEEEKDYVHGIESTAWTPSQSGRYKQDYGPKVNFKKRKCKIGSFTGLPLYSKFITQRLQSICSLNDFQPVELCNLEYTPDRGSAIDPHFDDNWLWGERLITLNLLSSTWLTMSWGGSENETLYNDSTGRLRNVAVKVPLKRRSLVVLYGPARHRWKHSILRGDIKSRRLCSTFRELSEEFLTGDRKDEGLEMLNIANTFDANTVL